MDFTNIDNIKATLRKYSAHPVKDFGQNFLINRGVLDCVVASAELTEDDVVVEVGPGLGVLTTELLAHVKTVYAFEYDPYMQEILKDNFKAEIESGQLILIGGDVLRTAPAILADLTDYKLVANIPYQITSPLLTMFLEPNIFPSPKSMTIMVQNEVGERLTAQPGKSARSFLSILAQFYAEVRYIQKVASNSFWPAPKVESAIISLKLKSELPTSKEEEAPFLSYVRRYFGQRRKQLKNVIAGIRGVSQVEISAKLEALGLSENARAQELSMDEWLKLFKEKI